MLVFLKGFFFFNRIMSLLLLPPKVTWHFPSLFSYFDQLSLQRLHQALQRISKNFKSSSSQDRYLKVFLTRVEELLQGGPNFRRHCSGTKLTFIEIKRRGGRAWNLLSFRWAFMKDMFCVWQVCEGLQQYRFSLQILATNIQLYK